MLRYFFKDKRTGTDEQITSVLIEMQQIGVISSDYPMMMTYLERLNEVKAKERRAPVSRDTIALILGNLAGIILIVAYEQKHVITSKGFNLINKPR